MFNLITRFIDKLTITLDQTSSYLEKAHSTLEAAHENQKRRYAEELAELPQKLFEQAKMQAAEYDLRLADQLKDPAIKKHFDALRPQYVQIAKEIFDPADLEYITRRDTDELLHLVNTARKEQASWTQEQKNEFLREHAENSKVRVADWQMEIDEKLRDPVIKALFDANDAAVRARFAALKLS